VIHAFAVEPQLAATWGRREEYRYIYDKFGLGKPRVLLELPAFNKWKKRVYEAATALALSQEDMKRIELLFQLFGEHKHRRADAVYDGLLTWLENAEREYARRPFAGILATQNPRRHLAVLVAEQLGAGCARWACDVGATPSRTPEALAQALAGMLTNCRQLHLIDPHFGPENSRHRKVLEALMNVIAANGISLDLIRVHCSEKYQLDLFEAEASKMALRLPSGISIEFVRWRQKSGGERLHNRYVLTDVGGVSLGVGLDAGDAGQTEDISLRDSKQYVLRWEQYAGPSGAFDCVDRPAKVMGQRTTTPPRRNP
jgi:hypothetical protein